MQWYCILLGVVGGSNKVPTLADLMAADVFELSGWEEEDEVEDKTAAEETDFKVRLLHKAVHFVRLYPQCYSDYIIWFCQ